MNIVDKLLANAGLKPRLATGHGLTVRILLIGPDEARALLAANQDNRPLRPGRVRFYAKVMRQGGWYLTHQGIAFSKSGQGLDLQHRLTAIIRANITVMMMVTEGLNDEAFKAIDQHERRTMADALREDRSLVDLARFFILARGGNMQSNPSVLEVGEVCGVIEDLYNDLRNACATKRKVYSATPVRAAAILTMHEHPRVATTIAQRYRALVLDHTESWTRVMHAFGKQERSGTLGSSGFLTRLDLFARALVMFAPDKEDLTKIQIGDPNSELMHARVRGLIGAITNDGEDRQSGNSLPSTLFMGKHA